MIENLNYYTSEVFDGPLTEYDLGHATFFYGHIEERSNHFNPDDTSFENVTFINILEDEENGILEIDRKEKFHKANLGKIKHIISNLSTNRMIIDITGLTHSVWAPLIKLGLELRKEILIIYVEPKVYNRSENPTGGYLYDLSEKTTGISPIPGFASLPGIDDEDYLFVSFLGFEGPRFSYALEQLDPAADEVIPIIGVPGYRPEYPFYSYEGNFTPISRYKAWKRVRYASASCPFSAYSVLEEIRSEHPNKKMKIAILGTKPHAIGAILFRLTYADSIELIYDHPIRKIKRTSGAMNKHVFNVSEFISKKTEFIEAVSDGRLR